MLTDVKAESQNVIINTPTSSIPVSKTEAFAMIDDALE